jgi:hypothetical protein
MGFWFMTPSESKTSSVATTSSAMDGLDSYKSRLPMPGLALA